MNDDIRLERLLADGLHSLAPTRAPDGIATSIKSESADMAPRPRWLALIKESPMRTNSRLAVGSPTWRVAAIVAATLLMVGMLALAGVAGARLLAADGVIVVDQSGDGHYTTITEAVAAASDGDEILVKPGTYAESVTIDKDITLRGEDRDAVVIEFGHGCTFVEDFFSERTECPQGTPMYDGPATNPTPYGLVLDDVDAEVSDLRLSALANGFDIVARSGAPSIHDIDASSDSDFGGAILVHDGSAAEISDTDLGRGGWIFIEEQSPATVERSSFWAVVANTSNTARTGGPSTIRDNHAVGILFKGPAQVTGNTVVAPDGEELLNDKYGQGIDAEPSTGWLIADNTVTGFTQATAIEALSASGGTITGNTLEGNLSGISVGSGGSHIEGNTVTGVGVGVGISLAGGTHDLIGNVVEDHEGRGISLGTGTNVTLQGNRSCGNRQNLFVSEGVEPVVDDTNEICADGT